MSGSPLYSLGQDPSLRLGQRSVPRVVVVGKDLPDKLLQDGLRLKCLLLEPLGVAVASHLGGGVRV